MAERTIKVTLVGDADRLSKAFKDAGDSASGLGKHLGDVAKIAGGFVIGTALTQGPALFNSLTGAASDMNETVSKARTIFGDQGAAIEQWASGAAKSFGQSKQGALDAAATFGNLFVQLGTSSDVAADMSTKMVELASDFASFHNANPPEVIDAMTAAFRGEYDAVQRFVPTINAAAVEQKALEQTGKKLTKELTAQEKAIAVQALLYEGAGAALGDFARTSDGAANKQRILDARMADLSATLGQKLLPIKVKVTEFILDKLIPAFEKIAPTVGRVFDAWVTLQATQLQAIAKFVEQVRPHFEAFAAAAQEQFKKFAAYWESDIKPALDNIRAGIENVVAFIREHWPEIERIVGPVLEQVKNNIQTTVEVVMGIFDVLIKLIQGDFSGAWNALKDLIGTVWQYIGDTIGNAKDLVVGILGTLKDLALGIFGQLKDGVIGATDQLRDGVVGAWNNVKDAIGGVVDGIRDRVVGVFEGMVGAVKNIVNGLVDGINGVIGRINSALEFSVSIPGVNMPDPIPDIPGVSYSFDAPDIGNVPRLAAGAIVRARPGGTIVNVGEGGRDEAVIPLEKGMGRRFGGLTVYGTLQLVLPNVRSSDDLLGALDRVGAW